jgi:uracil-DNA glycosylase family 4
MQEISTISSETDPLKFKYTRVTFNKLKQVDVLFVVTSMFDWYESGQYYPFAEEAHSVVKSLLKRTSIDCDYEWISAVPFADVNEEILTDNEVRAYREEVEALINVVNPKLIIPLGNSACLSVLKKSGIYNKRGKEFFIETGGKQISVIPSLHPTVVYLEPTVRRIFVEDLTNAYNKVILGMNKPGESSYKTCMTMEEVRKEFEQCFKAEKVSVDLETTGLDFHTDKITCFGASYKPYSAFVVPFKHFESPYSDKDLEEIKGLIKRLLEDRSIKKILANPKFDQKFLMNEGITAYNNVHDVQLLHALLDENRGHALSEIVKMYYPKELQEY